MNPVSERPIAPPDAPSLIDIADLALALGTDLESGLGVEEAANRLLADGPNELRTVPPVPPWRRALAQLQDPLGLPAGCGGCGAGWHKHLAAMQAQWLTGPICIPDNPSSCQSPFTQESTRSSISSIDRLLGSS